MFMMKCGDYMKKRLNNKGFAVSLILYTSVTLVIIVLILIVSILSTNWKNKSLIVDNIKKNMSGVEEKKKESLGSVIVTASDNIASGNWHKDEFTLDLSKSSNISINFPISYYYGYSLDSINHKVDDDKIYIQDNTKGKIYYIKACRTGHLDVCTDVSQYIVRMDKDNPDFYATGESNTWKQSATFDITATSICGIAYYEYYVSDWDFEPNEDYSLETFTDNTVTLDDTGKFIYIRAVDNLGKKSKWKLYDLYVDSEKPMSPTIVADDSKVSGEWHKASTLSVSGSTSLSGIDYYYSTTSDDPDEITTAVPKKNEIYSVSFSTNTYGTNFAVMACNKAKVCSDVSTYLVKIDTTVPKAPTVSGGNTTWTTDPKTFTITSSSSSISGVAYYEYYISKSTTAPSATVDGTKRFTNTQVSIDTPGRYIYIREVNNAGTAGAWTGYKNLYVDLSTVSDPIITAADNKISGEWHTADFTLNFTNENDTVPLTYYYGTSETSLGTAGASKKHTTNTASTTYYVKACKTSNTKVCSSIKSYEVKMDKTIPAITVSGTATTWANSRALTIKPTSTSGISYYEYAIADTTPTDETENIVKFNDNTLNITDTGKFIYIKAVNKVGLSSAWQKLNLYVDNDIPVSPTIIATDKKVSGEWHWADIVLRASGSSARSGVSYYYSTTSEDPYDSSFKKMAKDSSGNWYVKHTTNIEEQNYYFAACNNTPNKVCSPVVTYLVKLDKTPLSKLTVNGGNNVWTTSGVEFTITSPNTSFSGFSHYEYYLSTSTTAPASTVVGKPFTSDIITITEPGKYIYFREVDNAGRKSAWSACKNLFIDEPNLKAPIITAGDNIESGEWHTAATKLTFTNELTSIPLTYYYGTNITDVDNFKTAGNAVTQSSSIAEVTYYVKACRSDSSKTVCSDISSYTLKIDKDSPTVSVRGTSSTWEAEKTLTLTSNPVSGIDHYEYYISNSTTAPSASITEGVVQLNDPTVIIKYPEAGKFIYFRVVNNVGKVGAWTSYQNLYVDSITPESPIITAGDNIESGEWHKTPTKLTFSGSTAVSTLTYKYYNSENSTIINGSSIAANAQLLGTATPGRTYYVKACNSANLCSDEVSYLYKMDNTTPLAPGVEGGDNTWTTAGRIFTITPPVSASEIDYYEYYISNSTTAPSTTVEATERFTTLELTVNNKGKYIYFRAINKLGTVGKWSAYKNLFVDNDIIDTPVITADDKILSGEWHTAATKLTFSGSTTASAITYYYGTDPNDLTITGTSIANTSMLLKSNTDGITIYVKACNTAGTCSDIASYLYKLDNVTPGTPKVTGGSNTWTKEGKEFTITSTTTSTMVSGSKGFEYYVSTSTTAPGAGVTATGIVTESPAIINTPGKFIYFREVSNAGKKSAWVAYKNLYVDYPEYPKPDIIVSDNIESGNWHTTTNVKLTFSAPVSAVPVTYYYYTSANATEKAATTYTDASSTTDITYYVKVCRADSNKTSCSDISSYHMKIDSKVPTVTLTGPSTTWTSTKTLEFKPTAFSGIEYYEYYLSNSTTAPTGEEETIQKLYDNQLTVLESYQYIWIRMKNIAGKISGWVKFNLYVDSLVPIAPTITANDSIESGKWHIADTTLTFASESKPLSGIIYKYHTSSNSNYVTATTAKITAYTEATIYYVVACTKAGVCSQESTYTVKLDKSAFAAPTVVVTNDQWDAGPKMFTLSHTNSGIDTYEYYISDINKTPAYTEKATGLFTGNMISIDESGVYIYFRAVNKLGRSGNWSNANKLFINTALLSNIEVEDYELEPLFVTNTYLYSVTVPCDVTKININTDAFSDTTKIKISNNDNLEVGLNTIYVETENNGATAIYRIEVTRLEDTTNTLKTLTVGEYELEPVFDENTNEYNLTVDNDVSTIIIDAIPTRDNETIDGIGEKTLEVGENVFVVTVTAASGDVNIYKITITRN